MQKRIKNNLSTFILIKVAPLKLFIIFLALSISCSEKKNLDYSRIVIGVQSDVQTLNPMFAFSLIEGNLIDLLFMKPAMEIWNEEDGRIDFEPMLAEKWEWSDSKKSITIYLRDDIFWSDGIPITTDDIIFSLDVYSDPIVQSRFFGQFENFFTAENKKINIEKTFNKVSSKILEINFREESVPDFLDINLEIIPKHVWSKFNREEFAQQDINFNPVTSGPFKLIRWEREANIILKIDSLSFLYNPNNISEIILKIIPDYTSRLNHLKTREIDILDNIKSEDANDLKEFENLKIASLRGRDYDYIGWNHIAADPNKKLNVTANKFFSSPDVRKALTFAINRKEIIESYLEEFGELCKGPVSPMFKYYYDNNLKVYNYNPARAKELLEINGWEDKDANGIIEKDGVEFSFDLYTNTGNPRRNYVATVVKNNLNAVGIRTNIKMIETGTFIEGLFSGDYDAWIAGWTIPVPINLNPYWNSDPEIGFLNFSGYQNTEKDELLRKLNQQLNEEEKKEIYKKLQYIFHEDEPVTFLYWFDNIIAYNNRIAKINFSMLGLVKNAWEWSYN